MLDSVFIVPPVYDDSYYGYRIHEITEMEVAKMGNYAYGNQPWKAQKHIRQVMDRLYSAAPDGYCGDEDNGQTSPCVIPSTTINPKITVHGDFRVVRKIKISHLQES